MLRKALCLLTGPFVLLLLLTVASAEAAEPPATITALEELGSEELERLFASGSVPRLEELEGRLRGRAILPRNEEAFCGWCEGLVRALFRSPFILWAGKEFYRDPEGAWNARNLFYSASFGHGSFRMRPVIAASPMAKRTVLFLDYRNERNPAVIQRVLDEVVAVAPGLWLGRAWYRVEQGAPVELVWFALEQIP